MVDPTALILSLSGILVMAFAYRLRHQIHSQGELRAIIVIAVGQVLLGIVVQLLNLLAR